MRIYYAATEGFDAERAIAPGRGRSMESAAAWSLLLYALRRKGRLDSLPEAALDGHGKPYFAGRPECCFSLSHTRGFVVCALGSSPVGVDAQIIDAKDAAFAGKLMSERERENFVLHELWCLREAVYKLTGQGSLRTMPMRRESGEIVSPFEGVRCRLYKGLNGCECAAAAYAPEALPEELLRVDARELQKGTVI